MNNKRALTIMRFSVALSLALIACFYLGTVLNVDLQIFLILILGTAVFTFYCFALIIIKRSLKLLGPASLGFLALSIVTFNPIDFIIEKMGSPVLLSAYCEHPISGHSLLLKANGDFVHTTARLFRPRQKEYGTYTLDDDTLTLHFRSSSFNLIRSSYIIEKKALNPLPDTSKDHHGFLIYENHLEY